MLYIKRSVDNVHIYYKYYFLWLNNMRGGASDVNETQKWATSKKRLRTTDLDKRPETETNRGRYG
jgi:hypothetical protein